MNIINTTISSPALSIIIKTHPNYTTPAEISCLNSTGGFAFTTQNSVELTNLKFTGCSKVNASIEIRNAQTANLTSMNISQMHLQGAILLINISQAFLSNINVMNCSSTNGTLFIAKSNVTIQYCQFIGNQGIDTQAGAILMSAVYPEYDLGYNNTLRIDSSLFENNVAYGCGGAMAILNHVSSLSYVEVTRSIFRSNQVWKTPEGFSAGGALCMDETMFRVENSLFIENFADCLGTGLGGAIVATFSPNSLPFTNVIKNSNFTSGSACRGAGIYYSDYYSHPVDFDGILVTGNQGTFAAGALFEQASGMITNSVFSSNLGDGVYTDNSIVQFIRVTVADNQNYGFQCDGNITLYDPSVYGNSPDFSNCSICSYLNAGNYSSSGDQDIDPCQDCSRDLCTVCNGNNTCLGCSGKPWDTTSCGSPSPSPSRSPTSVASLAPTSSPTNTSHNNPGQQTPIGAIIGSTVGGVVLLIGSLVAFIIIRKRKKHPQDTTMEDDINMDAKEPAPEHEGRYNNEALAVTTVQEPSKTIYSSPVYGQSNPASTNFYTKESSNAESNHAKKPVETWKDIKNITVFEQLGEGNFGAVYKGMWGSTVVALKKIKDPELGQIFDKEAQLLSNCQHPHIVQYLGLFHDGPDKYIVTEFMSKGSLDQLLYDEQDTITQSQMISLAQNIAAGMEYLSSQGLVHRDLALRNILVTYGGLTGQQYIAKVADFGLARETSAEYYRADKKSAIPVKWSAPEALEYGKFSTKSDVWSFGVVLWELFSFGKRPYVGIDNEELLPKLASGYRLPSPPECPEMIQDLMKRCWSWKPVNRPSFEDISKDLLILNNNKDIK